MKSKIFVLFFLVVVLLRSSYADDKFYFYLECDQGHQCIDLPGDNGKMESVRAIPAMVLTKAEVASASVQRPGPGQRSLNVTISEEASKKLVKITSENIGRRLIMFFDDRFLTASTINMAIADKTFSISSHYGKNGFWEGSAWLQDLIKISNKSTGRDVLIYAIIAFAVSISAIIFVFMPKMKRKQNSAPDRLP